MTNDLLVLATSTPKFMGSDLRKRKRLPAAIRLLGVKWAWHSNLQVPAGTCGAGNGNWRHCREAGISNDN
ncbi:hypothetical protein EVAR_67020_1 [Eumeta japonica]|uniref:Uncharacterized protein n=1 Tax=Eumeta variegata TaxID=151549 RepID=A0A4C1ZPC6_EUMVA|nr:hypothetical protein EVAR_67020_1 [Eumeta japonica]